MNNKDLQSDTEIIVSRESNKIRIITKFGPIEFSYQPDELKEGLSNSVSTLLQIIQSKNLDKRKSHASQLDSRLNRLKEHLQAFSSTSSNIPNSSLNALYSGRRPYLDGSVEQLIDYLPMAITLMMSHMAFMVITSSRTERRPELWEKNECGLCRLIATHFDESLTGLSNSSQSHDAD